MFILYREKYVSAWCQLFGRYTDSTKKGGKNVKFATKEWPGGGTEVFEIGQNAPKELKILSKKLITPAYVIIEKVLPDKAITLV